MSNVFHHQCMQPLKIEVAINNLKSFDQIARKFTAYCAFTYCVFKYIYRYVYAYLISVGKEKLTKITL